MKARKRNTIQAKIRRFKPRNTRTKEIAALVRQSERPAPPRLVDGKPVQPCQTSKLRAAQRLARGWSLKAEDDPADRLVAGWQVMGEMQKDATVFRLHGAQILNALHNDTALLVGRAILSGDAALFRRIANRIKRGFPNTTLDAMYDMRRVVLQDRIEAQREGRQEKDAKEIASLLESKDTLAKADDVRRFRRQIRSSK